MWQFPVLVDSEILVSRSCLIRGWAVGWKNLVAANIMARKRVGCSSLTKARVWTVKQGRVQHPLIIVEHWSRRNSLDVRSGSRRTINGLSSRVNLFTAKRPSSATYLINVRSSTYRLSLTGQTTILSRPLLVSPIPPGRTSSPADSQTRETHHAQKSLGLSYRCYDRIRGDSLRGQDAHRYPTDAGEVVHKAGSPSRYEFDFVFDLGVSLSVLLRLDEIQSRFEAGGGRRYLCGSRLRASRYYFGDVWRRSRERSV